MSRATQICNEKIEVYGEDLVVDALLSIGQEESLTCSSEDDVEVLKEEMKEYKKKTNVTIRQLKRLTQNVKHQDQKLKHQDETIKGLDEQVSQLRTELYQEKQKKAKVVLTRLFDRFFEGCVQGNGDSVGKMIVEAKSDTSLSQAISTSLQLDFSLVQFIHKDIRRQRNRTMHYELPDDEEAFEAVDTLTNASVKVFFQRVLDTLY